MKQEDFETVTQLGTVAIKTIIIFLALIIAVGVGVYWYSSELEEATSKKQQENNNTQVEEEDEPALYDEWVGTILEINQEDNQLVFAVEGEQATVSFGEDTTLITENQEESLTIDDLVVENTIRVIGSMDIDTGVVQAQEIIRENEQSESSSQEQGEQEDVTEETLDDPEPATNEDPTTTEESQSEGGAEEVLSNEDQEIIE